MSGHTLKRSEIWLSLLLFALVVAALFPEVSVGGRTIASAPHVPFVLPSGPVGMTKTDRHPLMDAYDAWIREANYPYLERALRSGGLPFWMPQEACGNPFLAGLLHGVLFPPNWLMFVGAQPLGFDLAYLARLVLAGWLMFLFLRVRGLEFLGAFVGGVLFLGCGYLVGGLNLPNACVEVMIPGLLLGLECLLARRRLRDLALAAGMVALVLIGGNPQAAFLALAFGGAYGAVRILVVPRSDRIACAARFVTAHVLGAMLAAPQLLPFLEFLSHAAHTHVPGFNVATLPWQTSILWIVPEFFRNAYHRPEMAASGGFYGLATLGWILAPIAFAGPGHRSLARFSAVSLVLGAAWLFGAPGSDLLNRLPVINQIQIHKYLSIYLCLLPAILGGIGADHLARLPARKAAVWLGFSAAGVALVPLGFVALWNAGKLQAVASGALRVGPADPVVPALSIPTALGGAMLVICALLFFRSRFKNVALGLLVAMALAEVAAHVPRDYPPRADIYRPPSFLSGLTGDRRTYRVYSSGPVLYPNTAVIFGLNDIRYADALKIDRYVRLVQQGFSYPEAYNYFPLLGRRPGAPAHVLALLGVRYVLAVGELEELGHLPIPAGCRQEINVDLTTESGDLVGTLAAREGGEVRLSVRLNDPKSGRLTVLATFSGDGTETHRLRSSPPGEGAVTCLGIDVPAGGCLEIESVVWAGRPVTADVLRRSSHNLRAAPADPPLRFTAPTVIALPSEPPGSTPELVIRGRTAGAPVRVALITVESVPLAEFSSRADQGDENRERFRIDLRRFAGRSVQLSLFPSGTGAVVSLGFESAAFVRRGRFDGIRLFEHRWALPRAYGVYRAEIVPDEEGQLRRVLDPRFPLGETVVLPSRPAGLALPDRPPAESPRITWREEHPSGSRIELEAEFAANGLLVLHDNHYPGWHAYVDGELTDLARADFCFRAVPVAAGRHRVEFRYEPLSWKLGLLISGFALLAFLILCLRGRRRPER